MRRVLFVRQNMPGGTAMYCQRLYELFEGDSQLRILPPRDIPSVSIPFAHYRYSRRVLLDAIEQADIIHINGYTAWGTVEAIKWAHKCGKKIVYTAHWHPFAFLRHPALGELFFNVFLKNIVRKYCDVIVTINKEDTRFFSSFCNNVVQIPHWYTKLPEVAEAGKRKDMLLFIGRPSDPVKGIEHLDSLPLGRYEIHIVGKGNVPGLRNDFIVHGSVSDQQLSDLYDEASLVVIPSKYEAFSYVALEALLHGTPVLMSDRVRIADYLDGVEGIGVFKYGNYEEFTSKIESTINSHVNVEKVRYIFSPASAIRKYRSVYLDR